MKKNKWIGWLIVSLSILIQTTPCNANPIISVDLDPSMPGIQSMLTTDPGMPFVVDVVIGDNGMGPVSPVVFDTAILQLTFDSSVLSVTGTPIAGSFATNSDALDVLTFMSVFPGDPITVDSPMPGTTGGVGLFAFPPFSISAPGSEIFFSIEFTPIGPGTSPITPVGFPDSSDPALALAGTDVSGQGQFVPGNVTVQSDQQVIPEPGSLVIFSAISLAALGFRCLRSQKKKI